MRTITITATIILAFSPNLYALMRMGPPVSELDKGYGSIAFEYGNSKENFDEEGIEIEDVEINQFYGRLGIGLNSGSEIFARIGAADIENLSTSFGWGIGTKAGLAQKDSIKIGAIFQMTAIYGNLGFAGFGYGYSEDVSIYDWQFGIGPCLDADKFCLYAYPIYHFVTGEDEINDNFGSFTLDIEQADDFGACIGMDLKFDNNTNLNIEGQFIGDSYMVGAGMVFKFGEKNKPIKTKSGPMKSETGRNIKGYKATINPATGKPEFKPVYEGKK